MSKHFQNNEDKRIKIITAVFITFANLPLEGALLAHRNAEYFTGTFSVTLHSVK